MAGTLLGVEGSESSGAVKRACCLVGAAVLVACPPLLAQGTITHFDASFERILFGNEPQASLTVDGVADHLYETGWWYRVAGDVREFSLGSPASESYVFNESTLTWKDVGGRGLFDARESTLVYDTGLGGIVDEGYVDIALSIYNRSSTTPLTIVLFNFVDFDLDADAGDDSARLAEFPSLIGVTDPSGTFAHYYAELGTAHYVRTQGSGDASALLSDSDLDAFDSTGLPFGPGDFTGAYSWEPRLIPPLGTSSFRVYLAVNKSLHCGGYGLFCEIGRAHV